MGHTRWGHFEKWDVVPNRDGEAQFMGGALGGVVLSKPLAQPVHLDANDGVGVLVERFVPAEDLEGDRVLLDLDSLAGKMFFAKIGKQMGKRRGADEELGFEHRLKFGAFQFHVERRGGRRHPDLLAAPNFGLYTSLLT